MKSRPIELVQLQASTRIAGQNLPAPRPQFEMALLSDLHLPTRRLRHHPNGHVARMARVLKQFGFINPMVIGEGGEIVCGEVRYAAAKHLDLKRVPVIRVCHLTPAELRAYRLVDNRLQEASGWNRPELAAELLELGELLPKIELDLEITGFDPPSVDSLLSDLSDTETDPVDELPVLSSHAVTRRGDLWQLGPHRLSCGDSTSEANFDALMGGELAALVLTDPPYNLEVDQIQGRGKRKHREFAQASGEMSSAQFTRFLSRGFSLSSRYSVDGALQYYFMDWRHTAEILAAGKKVYSELKNIIVWVKTQPRQGSFYRSQHEFIFVFKTGSAPHLNNIQLGKHGRNRSNVWTYPGVNTFRAGQLDDLTVHPTVKPVAMIADAMRDSSRRGDIVLDPFAGSGTVFLAAEKVGRRAYGLEIDPIYVDAAIRRWQAFSKRDAVLISTGETFDDVAARAPTTDAGSPS